VSVLVRGDMLAHLRLLILEALEVLIETADATDDQDVQCGTKARCQRRIETM
jgi:hypothetical protein